MRKYTVLLLYPDYMQGGQSPQTYMAHVESANANKAERNAKAEAAEMGDTIDPDDFAILAVFEGHLEDLSGSAK